MKPSTAYFSFCYFNFLQSLSHQNLQLSLHLYPISCCHAYASDASYFLLPIVDQILQHVSIFTENSYQLLHPVHAKHLLFIFFLQRLYYCTGFVYGSISVARFVSVLFDTEFVSSAITVCATSLLVFCQQQIVLLITFHNKDHFITILSTESQVSVLLN